MRPGPIKDNPFCKTACKHRYCERQEEKDAEKDRSDADEAKAINELSKMWKVNLKQTDYKYCPYDFYSTDLRLIGDITCPSNEWMRPVTATRHERTWGTPGWIIRHYKLGTLISSLGEGIISFYVWRFPDCIKTISADDILRKTVDTTSDPLSANLNMRESTQIKRSEGMYIHPMRLCDPNIYTSCIQGIIASDKVQGIKLAAIDSTEDLERSEKY